MRILSLILVLFTTWQSSAATKNGFDLEGALMPVKEICSGSPLCDGIPAINQPKFETIEQATWLIDQDRVLALVVNGEARAYPILSLNWHEIVNDRVHSQSCVVSYCPLSGTGMVFASNFADIALQFGVSGLLYESDVLLYDRNSESLWSQIVGQAIAGRQKGTGLPQLPAVHTTWKG